MISFVHMLQRFAANESGVTAIEFAFVAPILFMALLGTIEYGIIFHVQSLASHAGNEAARLGKTGSLYGSQGTREQLIEAHVLRIMEPWIKDEGRVTVRSESYGNFNDVRAGGGGVGPGIGGQVVLYTVTYNWPTLMPGMTLLVGEDGIVPIHARALVKNEVF